MLRPDTMGLTRSGYAMPYPCRACKLAGGAGVGADASTSAPSPSALSNLPPSTIAVLFAGAALGGYLLGEAYWHGRPST